MNAKTVKNKKNISVKSISFWSLIGAIVLTLLILLTIRIVQTRDIKSYDKLDSVAGAEIFNQEEEIYFVLFYDFNNDESMETFDQSMFSYLTYYRDNKNNKSACKVYKADSTNVINSKCLGSQTNISNTTKFPNSIQQTGSDTLQISTTDLPVLLIITGKTVTDYKMGETAILTYLNDIKNNKV